jgi:hypothetical protein
MVWLPRTPRAPDRHHAFERQPIVGQPQIMSPTWMAEPASTQRE